MTIETQLTLTGALAILLLDTINSLLSVHFHFPIRLLCLATPFLYLGLTYWAAKYLKLLGTLGFGALLGLIDATIGCKLCSWLGEDLDSSLQNITFSRWCSMVVLVMIFGAFMAFVAFSIASLRNKRESR